MKKNSFLAFIISFFLHNLLFSQGIVTKRHNNGQKLEVCVYSGAGISEVLNSKYEYRESPNNLFAKTEYDVNGYAIKYTTYSMSGKINTVSTFNPVTKKGKKVSYDDTGAVIKEEDIRRDVYNSKDPFE